MLKPFLSPGASMGKWWQADSLVWNTNLVRCKHGYETQRDLWLIRKSSLILDCPWIKHPTGRTRSQWGRAAPPDFLPNSFSCYLHWTQRFICIKGDIFFVILPLQKHSMVIYNLLFCFPARARRHTIWTSPTLFKSQSHQQFPISILMHYQRF